MKSPRQCVIHCRVSTAKQAYEGESLEVQKSICLEIANRNGWRVAHEPWLEAYSGRKSTRPAFTEVLAFLDTHPGAVSYYVFRAIDRFTRGGSGTYENMKEQLARRGVELVDSMGVIQPLRNTLEDVGFEYDWSRVSPSEVAEAVLATTAKAEATTILTRIIGQEIRLTQQGYRARGAVDGYRNERIAVGGKRRVIQVPDPDRAKFYVAMFELRASGTLTDADISTRLNAMGFLTRECLRWDASHQRVIGRRGGHALTPKKLVEIVRRPIYCGVVWEKWTNWKPIKASYPGLVSIETWNAANRNTREVWDTGNGLELRTRTNLARTLRSKDNPEFRYRRVVLCPMCGKAFLGSSSRSRAGHHVPAYHCARGHKRVSRNKQAFEFAVGQFVGRLRFQDFVVKAAVELLTRRYNERVEQRASDARAADRHIADLESQKAEAVRAYLAATSPTMRQALEHEVERLEIIASDARSERHFERVTVDDFAAYVKEVSELMEHPGILLETQANPTVLRSRFDLAFAQLPTLSEIESGTAKLSPILYILEGEDDLESVLVRLSRLTWNQIEAEIRNFKKYG